MPFHSGRQKVQFDADLLLLWLEILHDLGAVDRGVVSHHHPVLTTPLPGEQVPQKGLQVGHPVHVAAGGLRRGCGRAGQRNTRVGAKLRFVQVPEREGIGPGFFSPCSSSRA